VICCIFPAENWHILHYFQRVIFLSCTQELDRFFQQYAGQNQFRHHIGTTYVLADKSNIAGFVTVSAGEITPTKLSSVTRARLPEYPLPILRIARLAVDKRFQGLGLGKKLLRASFELALDMKSRYGCVGVVVDAKPESVSFYQEFGFLLLESDELHNTQFQSLFLSIKFIQQAISK
jgi:GNAT superfamily N-acetyltransferase